MRSPITTVFARLFAPPNRVREQSGEGAVVIRNEPLARLVAALATVSSDDDPVYVRAREALGVDAEAVIGEAERVFAFRGGDPTLRAAVAMALASLREGRAVELLVTTATPDLDRLEPGAARRELAVATTAVDSLAALAHAGVTDAAEGLATVASAQASLTTTGLALAHLNDLGQSDLFETAMRDLPPARRYLGALRRMEPDDMGPEPDPYLGEAPPERSPRPPAVDSPSSAGYRRASGTPRLRRPAHPDRKDSAHG